VEKNIATRKEKQTSCRVHGQSFKVDVFHPEVFIKYIGSNVSVKTQQCGIRNIAMLHEQGYMFRLS
jgi:hypothetical protein